MQYTLMHKEVPVALLKLDETSGSISHIDTVYEPSHLPVGVGYKHGHADRAALNAWWIDRSIPASRSGIRQALETLQVESTKLLLSRCMGLSLSDQYWIRPKDSTVSWRETNFFENPFSDDIGDVLLGKAAKTDGFDFSSPDNTSDGCLKKRWKIINGQRCLLKAGSGPYMQQPFNEVIATRIMERLGIPHVPYTLLWDGDTPYSVCADFVTPDTELIPAWRVMQTIKRDNSTSVYRHYLQCCEALGGTDMVHALDQMIVLDYIIANEDRHQNNFGLLRDANTLIWLGAAPIFDSGSSLGYDKLAGRILAGRDVECKPFKKTHGEQIKLVTDFGWIDFDSLRGVGDDIRAVLAGAGEYADEARCEAIVSSVEKRIGLLAELAQTQWVQEDNSEQDVTEDVAAEYGFGQIQ